MCEGTPAPQPNQVPQEPSGGQSRRRRSRPGQDHGSSAAAVNAIDAVPPVLVQIATLNPPRRRLESSWQECQLLHQTPQLIMSLIWNSDDDNSNSGTTIWSPSVSPKLVDHTYLVVATIDGHLCIWNLSELLADATTNLASHASPKSSSTGTDVSPKVVSLSQARSSNNGRRTEEAGCVVSMCSYVVPKNNTSNSSGSIVVAATDLGVILGVHVPTGNIMFRFETKSCGVTSIAIQDIQTSTEEGQDDEASVPSQKILHVLVGYDIGLLECWEVSVSQSDENSGNDKNGGGLTTRKANGNDTEAKLVAQGSLESGYPIRSVLFLDNVWNVAMEHERPPDAASNTEVDALKSSEEQHCYAKSSEVQHCYVMLTLEPERQRSTATMVEVLDLTELQSAWKLAINEIGDRSEHGAKASKPASPNLELEQYRILPEPGMELSDASSLVNSHAPWIPAAGTNHLMALSSNSCNNATLRYAFGLPDGTNGIVSATAVENRLSWGITRRSNQLLLSYPCVGMGEVSLSASPTGDSGNSAASNSKTRFLACGLRGGTVYLIPVAPLVESTEDRADVKLQKPTIQVFSYPHDVDEDIDVVQQHVQGFTAGNVGLIDATTGNDDSTDTGGLSRCHSSIPIVIYAWPGGILDVYACHLLPGETAIPPSLIRSCLDNTSLQMLVEILMEQDVSSQGELWISAKKEVLALIACCSSDSPNSVEQWIQEKGLVSDSLGSFRRLLLHLAAEELQLGTDPLG